MLTFLLVVQAIVAVMLVGVILMQQSEGGGLGMGGSPSGLMSARGAADFLTRATTILATVFIGLSILHAVLATRTGTGVSTIDTSLARPQAPVAPPPTGPVAGQAAPATSPLPATSAPAPVAVPMATARPKVEVERVRPTAERTPATVTRVPAAPTTTAAPRVSPTVTPSITPAAPATAPVQGAAANSN